MKNKITHKHHIIPKHMGGTDDKSNLIELTVEEHAAAHKNLWEKHNNWQDYIAWKSLSGQITVDEARRLSVSFALKGKPKSKEQKEKMSISRRKRGGITTGMKLGPCSEERKQKISIANKGKKTRLGQKHTPETLSKMSASAKNRPTYICSKCGASMQKASLSRYHGLNGEKCNN